MKHFAMLSAALLLLAAMPAAAWGQVSKPPGQEEHKDHGNMGVYFDYSRLPQGFDLLGVGGRIGFNVRHNIVLEAEMAYDFQKTQTQTISAGGSTNTTKISMKMMDFLFGGKIQIPRSKHFFALAKAGMANFGVSGPAPPGGINNQIGGIVNGNVDAVFYPGGGVEFKVGRINFRAEAGDEIIWINNDAKNNLRATIGPQLRF
jgi:opacity protein-like surface antigen